MLLFWNSFLTSFVRLQLSSEMFMKKRTCWSFRGKHCVNTVMQSDAGTLKLTFCRMWVQLLWTDPHSQKNCNVDIPIRHQLCAEIFYADAGVWRCEILNWTAVCWTEKGGIAIPSRVLKWTCYRMTSTLNGITLRGSAELVAEFFCECCHFYLLLFQTYWPVLTRRLT